jgi:Flp pilus assembly protein TadG
MGSGSSTSKLLMPPFRNSSISPGRKVRARSKTQRGSALLEGALIILPLLALGFALLDYPLAIFIQNTLRNAVREGVRYAITQQSSAGGQDASITSVVMENSMGFLNDADISAGNASITITYHDKASLATVSGNGSNGQGNICVVTASVTRGWMAPLWRNSGLLTFSASSSDVMEAPPGGVLPIR